MANTIIENAFVIRNSQKPKEFLSKHKRKTTKHATWETFMELSEQSKIILFIAQNSFIKDIVIWKSVANKLPPKIYKFCRRYLVFSLSNASNSMLQIKASGVCSLCRSTETQQHIFNDCAQALDRYIWRHNSILYTISEQLKSKVAHVYNIYAECLNINFPSPFGICAGKRPDIVLQRGRKFIVIELRCPFELDMKSTDIYQEERYHELKNHILLPCDKLKYILLEISPLGFVTKASKDFTQLLKAIGCESSKLISMCAEVAIRSSYYIYRQRNKPWPSPDLLKFVSV